MYQSARYLPAGDNAVIMELGNEISPRINLMVRKVVQAIDEERISGVIEAVPTYRSIMVMYDPLMLGYKALVSRLKSIENRALRIAVSAPMITEIPTLYGGEYGCDIRFVADYNNLTVDEVIKIHSGTDYLIYMLGFTPGFPYLGGMSERIQTPRLEAPRKSVMAGSVGIAGKQTGIYSIDSPGGWHIIGRTPVRLFNPDEEEPILLKPGDYLRFIPVDRNEFERIEADIRERRYFARAYPKEEKDDVRV